MSKIFRKQMIFTAVLLFMICLAGDGAELPQRRIAQMLEKATVKVSTFDGERLVTYGSGFVISPEGFIGTNFHVINEAVRRNYKLVVQFVDAKEKHRAEVITWDAYHDFAVLKIKADKVELSALKIGNSSAMRPLDTIFVSGFPVTGAYKAQRGELNSTQTYDERKYFDISPLIDKGNSGGPVVNAAGEVIGVSVAFVTVARSINLAIRVQDIKNVIADGTSGKRKLLVRDGREVENNNTRTSANLIVHGLTIQGSLSANDPVDWFELGGHEGERPSVSLSYDAGCDYYLEIYSDANLSGTITGKEPGKNPVHTPGRCFFKVMRKSGEGPYKILIAPGRTDIQSGVELESNNSRALANRTRSMTLTGRLDENDTEDWFVLEGQEGTQPAITLSHGEGMNFDMEVYSDDMLVCSARGAENTETVACNVPGRCYVRIVRISGAGNYTVRVQRDGGTYSEQEPNDDRSMANLVRNLVIEGSLSAEDGDDWFELGGQEGNAPSFTLRHGANANFDFEVYSGDVLVCRGTGTGASETLRCNVPGRCFVHVWRVSGEGSYTLTIDPHRPQPVQQRPMSATGMEVEPNNSRETATLTRSMTLQGELSASDTEDWFELGGQEGTRPTFTITHDPQANFDFEVYSDGNLVCRATGSGASETIHCEVPGRCFVRVFRVSGAGRYTITIAPRPPRMPNPSGAEVEPNNSRETATFTSAMLLSGSLSSDDAEDWFELAGQEGSMPAFIINHAQNANFDFEVFSDTNSACRATGTGPTESIRCSVPGRCFIRVWRVSGAGNYTIQILR